MRWFTKTARPGRPGPSFRSRLRLEALDARALPGSMTGDDGGDPPMIPEPVVPLLVAPPPGMEPAPGMPPAPPGNNPPPGATAPEIVEFAGEMIGSGYYLFTGRVEAGASTGSVTVTFGGVPSLAGRTTMTAADGTFCLFVQVKTDGSDTGMVTAQASANGLTSNVAMWSISP